jgi:type II secretory pathway pseudopilin PulG
MKEVFIVVVIVGVLAAIAVPKLTNAATMSAEAKMREDLRFLRTQISVYTTHHKGVAPGYPGGDRGAAPTEALFGEQLMKITDEAGNPSAVRSAVFKWGPYVQAIPENPVSGKKGVTILRPEEPLVADGMTAWLYQPSTGILKPNVSGTDSEGHLFSDY